MNRTESLVPYWMIASTLTLSLIGCFGNIMIVAASLVSQQLRGRCQLMIAGMAAVDVIVCVYLVVLRILMFSNWYFVSNRSCFLVSVFGLFALNVQSVIGLIIGFDRLLAVSIPLKYPMLPKSVYVCFVLIIFVYAIIITLKGFLESDDVPVPICLPPTAYTNNARAVWIYASCTIAVLVIFVYGATNVKCRMLARNATDTSLEKIKRLMSSLNLIMAIYFFTWFITVAALLVTQMGFLSKDVVQIINQQLSWLVIINASLNFFIYWWRTPEYRKAFKYILSLGKADHPNLPSTVARTTMVHRQSITPHRVQSNKNLRYCIDKLSQNA